MQYLKQIWAILAIGWACSGGLMAQSSTVYFALNKLDNRQARIYGPGAVDDTFSTKTPFEVVLNNNSTYTLEINPEKLVASLELDIDRSGNIGSVRWKDADGSQTGGGYVNLSTSYYSLNQPNELTLFPSNMDLDYQQTNLGSIWFPEIWLSTLTGGANSMSLFPGDYEIQPGDFANNAGVCHLSCEVLASDGSWNTSLEWKEYLQMGASPPQWTTLNTNYFSFPAPNKLQLEGKSIYIDKQIDNDQLYYVNYEHLGSGSESLSLFPGNFFVSVGVGEGISAYVGMLFDMNLDQIQSNIVWLDPDSSQTGGPVPLDTGYVVTAGDTIRLKGVEVQLDLFASSNTVYFLNVAPGELVSGYNDLELFPGDYLVQVGGAASRLAFEVNATQRLLSEQLYCYDYLDIEYPAGAAHPSYVFLRSDSLKLHGLEVGFEVLPGLSQNWIMNALGTEGKVVPEDAKLFSLLPGRYPYSLIRQSDDKEMVRVNFLLAPEKPYFDPQLRYQDIINGTTNGEYVDLPPGSIYLEPLRTVIGQDLPEPPTDTLYQGPYASLCEHLDASFYMARQGEIWVKYEERYNDQSNLNIRILNASNQEMPLAAVARDYGPNWLHLDLSGAGFASGDYYVLEIRNARGELGLLKFRY